MAIFHLSVKSGSRGAGQSAAAHGEYIAREGKYAQKAVAELAVHVEHGNLPDFAQGDAHAFWRAADSHERANGRLWTELEVSIPRELSREDQLQLARDFRQSAIGENHAYSLAIHVPKTMDGKSENPHMHLMFSERIINERTKALDEETYFKRNGATKDRSWNDQAKVEEVRAMWEGMANKALERAGLSERIDRRSLAVQGLEHAPEPKIGRAAPEVRRALALVQAGKQAANLSERAQTALQVRALRSITQQRRGVVIELAKVREERQRKTAERDNRIKRMEGLPLTELRKEVLQLEPAQSQQGRPAWEREWSKLPEVAASLKARDAATAEVGYARGRIGAAERDLAKAKEAEQGYKKQHWFKSVAHSVGWKDTKLGELTAQRTALEKDLQSHQGGLANFEKAAAQSEAGWQAIRSNPELQTKAQEIHAEKTEIHQEARAVLDRREAERKHAETLAKQLAAAQRLGQGFDRERVPETVQGMLALLEQAKSQPGGQRQAQERLADTLTHQKDLRQIVEKALAPQMKAIDKEQGNEAGRSGGYGT
jgi:hypothetical protein